MNLIKNKIFFALTFLKNWFKKHWKLSLILIIIIALIGFWQYNKTQKNKPILIFQKVERRDLTKTLEISGVVDAKERVKMRFLAGGKITYVGAKEGDVVKKWQNIAAIDKASLKKGLEQDLNLYMKERHDFDQYNDDNKDNYFEKSIVRSASDNQFDLSNEVLGIEIADIAIRNTNIYAPFEGILINSPVTVAGVQILATDYFEIINPKTLVFKAIVDELDVGLLDLGKVAQIELDAHEDEFIDSEVNYISFISGQSSTGTVFVVELPLNSEDYKKYRLGMNGDVEIKLEKKEDVLVVPLDATIERDGKIYVNLKTSEDTYEEREIKVDLETDDELEVIDGLSENDEILLPE
jgi:HlyD family secretion protein